MPSLPEIKQQLIRSGIAAIFLVPVTAFLKKMLESWGILDLPAETLGDFLKINVSPNQAGWTLAAFISVFFYAAALWLIWRRRQIQHLPIGKQTGPTARNANYSPLHFVRLIEARGVPSRGNTALRIVVRNGSAENLTGLIASLIRTEPEIDGLDVPIHLPLTLATKTRLDKLRGRGEQLPAKPFDLNAGAEKQIEVAWLPSNGVLEASITHEAGEATYLVVGTHTLYVEVSGAGQPIVAGVKIEVADDDIQTWYPRLIVEAFGTTHGKSK